MKEIVKKIVKKRIRGFKHTVNSLFLKENSLVILLYHRVTPNKEVNSLGTVITSDLFEEQMRYLKEAYEIASLSKCYSEGVNKSKKLRVAITFDDGYFDNFKYAFPILKKLDIPATFFLATDYIDSGKPIWDQQLQMIVDESKDNFKIEDLQNNFTLERGSKDREDSIFLWEAINYLRFLSSSRRDEILKPIFSSLSQDIDFSDVRCLSWKEVKTMRQGGMHFGSHGCSHSSLVELSDIEIRKELLESKRVLEKELSQDCFFFALPFGSQLDFNPSIIKKVEEIGYLKCLLNIRGNNLIDSGKFSLKRKSISSAQDFVSILG